MQRINQRLFYVLIAVYGVVILLTFSHYGITTDEPLHVAYGENIWRWYTSFFRDQNVFYESNLWLYGGLFDTVIQVLRQVVPMDVYDLRHLVCAFVGLSGVVAAYKVGTVLGDYRTGIVAAIFLVLTPRYYGHAFNNSKDIPFAVAYLWSLYYLIRGMGELPFLSRSLIWKMGLALGCTLGVRASGTVLLGYMGLFWGVRYVQLSQGEDRKGVLQAWRVMFFRLCGIGIVSYLTLFPFFPWLQTHPFTGLWDSFRAFASFPEVHYNFFEGAYLASNAIPWYYVSKWLLLTLPEFVLLGLGAGLVVVLLALRREWWSDLQVLQRALMVFAVLFPLIYGALAKTPLLNAMRHMTFVVPPLAILSAVGVIAAVDRLSSARAKQGLVAGFAGLVLLALFDMVALHPNQYVYFNRVFAGGVAQASTHYETDYWNHVHKQGLRWVEAQAPELDRKIVIGSKYKNVRYMIDDARFEFTQKVHEADYYLGNTWFEYHRIVPGEVLHVVRAMGAPLLYVIRPDRTFRNNPLFLGSAFGAFEDGHYLRFRGDFEGALTAYDRTLLHLSDGYRAMWLDSCAVYGKKGNVLLQMGHLDEAHQAFGKISDQELFAGAIAHSTGIYYVKRKDYQQARHWLQKAVDVSPKFFEAHFSLASVLMRLGHIEQGVRVFREIGQRHLTHADRQIEVGMQFHSLGKFDDAASCFKRAVEVQYNNVQGHYYLGLTQAAKKDYASARKAFENAVALAPDNGEAWQSLGVAYLHLKNYDGAISAYKQAIAHMPGQAHLYSELGVAYLRREQKDLAKDAFDSALALDPNDATALQHGRSMPSVFEQ